MAEGNTNTVESLLQSPGDVLDHITDQLARVGIDLPPFPTQIFLLVLTVSLLIPTAKRLRPRKKADRAPLIAVAALGLLALGILIGVLDNATMSNRVSGSVQSDRLPDVRVCLLDSRGRTISSDSGLVDTDTGHFALHYSPLVDGRARKLRIAAQGCQLQEVELFRQQLRAGSELQWTYKCVPG